MPMETIEAQFTLSWASFFIDVEGKEELVYEDFIKIFHAMYNDVAAGTFLNNSSSLEFETVTIFFQ